MDRTKMVMRTFDALPGVLGGVLKRNEERIARDCLAGFADAKDAGEPRRFVVRASFVVEDGGRVFDVATKIAWGVPRRDSEKNKLDFNEQLPGFDGDEPV